MTKRQLNQAINRANKRIRLVKDELEITPWTLKSEANLFNVIIQQKGLSNEGEILKYDEANRQYMRKNGSPLSREIYDEAVNDLLNNFISNTYYKTMINNSYNTGMSIAETLLNHGFIDDDEFEKISHMPKKDLIKIMQDLGEQLNNLSKNHTSYDSEQVIDTIMEKYKLNQLPEDTEEE